MKPQAVSQFVKRSRFYLCCKKFALFWAGIQAKAAGGTAAVGEAAAAASAGACLPGVFAAATREEAPALSL